MDWGLPWWVGHGDPIRGVEAAHGHGFDRIEISLEAPWPGRLDADALGDAADDAGIGLGFHGPWRAQTLGHPREGLAEAALDVARACLAFAEDAGGDYLVLHVDPRDYGGYPVDDVVDAGVSRAVDGLADLVDRAEGVDVVVENTWPPLGTPGALKAVLDAVPGLGFCFDPGHAAITFHDDGGDPKVPAWQAALGDRWSLLHLMDAVVDEDGVVDHLVPGAGDLDVGGIVDAARKAGCDRVVVEAFHSDVDGTPARPGDVASCLDRLRA